MSTVVFLFAHQDDEVGLISLIKKKIDNGYDVVCAFLTDGGSRYEIRNKESLSVLNKNGVKIENIIFAGKENNLKDGELSKNTIKLKKWLLNFFKSINNIDSIYVTAYEGGHQDHDALHCASVIALNEIDLLDDVYQFPLYNKFNCIGRFFRVLTPLKENGEFINIKLSIHERLMSVIYCLYYPSQYKTWIGLLPFFILHYILNNTLKLQKVSIKRLRERPHSGKLLYESRGFYTWEKFANDIDSIR